MSDSDFPGDPVSTPVTPSVALTAGLTTGLADGQWHRLHPATPLLRGGIALIAILGVILNSFRERFIDVFVGGGGYSDDPIDWIMREGYVGYALAIVALGLLVFIAAFYLSWRMHTFRITNEVVEVRSGILFRTNRRGRLDRIQGINIVRPFLARLFGAAKLEVNVAGQDANVQLAYLGSAQADDLRRDILRLASGTRRTQGAAAPAGHTAAAAGTGTGAATGAATAGNAAGTFLDQRVAELLGPELDPDLAPPESVVKMNTGRLLGSILLNDTAVVLVVLIIASVIAAATSGQPFLLLGLLPLIIGMGSFLLARFTKSLRYSIAGTPDGVRVGFGLFTTSNETLPPGRIHSIQVSQPLLWRPFGWWEMKVNRASKSSTQGASGQQNTTILPVGNFDDVMRVLALMLPAAIPERDAEPALEGATEPAHEGATELALEGDVVTELHTAREGDVVTEATAANLADAPTLLRNGLLSRGGDDGFVNSPRRAAPLRWFSWRRNGYALGPGIVLLRKGAIWRELVVVPEPRVQSIALTQGPIERRLGLASVHLHTVAGPITAKLGAVEHTAALTFFEDGSRAIVAAATSDTSHRWRSGEEPSGDAPSAAPASAAPASAAPASTAPTSTEETS